MCLYTHTPPCKIRHVYTVCIIQGGRSIYRSAQCESFYLSDPPLLLALGAAGEEDPGLVEPTAEMMTAMQRTAMASTWAAGKLFSVCMEVCTGLDGV
jgi:hypothetical protein